MTQPHPRTFERASHYFWVGVALEDAFIIDFLSERAQTSIKRYLSKALEQQYVEAERLKDIPWDEKTKTQQRWSVRDDLRKAIDAHPLVAFLGEAFAVAIFDAIVDIYADLERGINPLEAGEN